MPDLTRTSGKHLTQENRQETMECLDKGMSFKDIARRVGKSPTTISREVKKHITIQPLSVTRTKIDGTPIDEKLCPLLLPKLPKNYSVIVQNGLKSTFYNAWRSVDTP
jgi:transcriptional regulator with XRE-family HTH domain